MSDCGTGSTNTRMGDAAPAVPDGSLTARSTCSGSKADAELLMARRAPPKMAAMKVLGGETHGTLLYEYNERTATSSLWARGQLLFTGVICHHSVC